MDRKIKVGIALIAKGILADSSDSSDEEILTLISHYRNPSRKKHNKVAEYVENTVLKYGPDDFKAHFRISRTGVEGLVVQLGFKNEVTPGRHPLKPLHALLLTLWTLSNQESFRGIGDRFGLQRGNAQVIFLNTAKLICRLQKRYIVWPEGDDLGRTVLDFNALRNISFPNVVGCVDGTHIPIKGPSDDNSFYNRKGFHSSILQVICNSKLHFIDIYFGWPGSVHDACVWQNSPIYKKLKEKILPENYHLLGDSAYPLDVFLMTPFKDNGHLTQRQKKFNQSLSSVRVVIEQAIGRLKQQFRRLKFLDAKLENMKYYVVAACVLYNYILKHDTDELVVVRDIEEDFNFDILGMNERNDDRRGKYKRDMLLAWNF